MCFICGSPHWPPLVLVSLLRSHPHSRECDGGDGGGTRLGEGGGSPWCPIQQETGNQAAVFL